MARTKSIGRDRILDAVEGVVNVHGPQALTLDLVAGHASISKGGLTYSFATKEELLLALLERDASRCKSKLHAASAKHPASAYPELVALIEGCRKGSCPMRAKSSHLLAALMHAPASLEPSRAFFKWMYSRFPSDKPGDRRARIAFTALEGMLIMQGLGLIDLPPNTRTVLFSDLIRLVSRDLT